MSALTENEIFDCMSHNLRLAAEHCDLLAVSPAKGPTYKLFREELLLIEGCCRQAGYWREDTRWLPIGQLMESAHKRAGGWLRGVKLPNGTLLTIRPGELHPLFAKLAENLRAIHVGLVKMRTEATHRSGIILPDVMPGPHRDTRPSRVILPPGMLKTSGGIILPGAL